MMSDIDYVVLLCEQIAICGNIKYKRFEDRYLIFCNDKEIFTIIGYKILVKNNEFTRNNFNNLHLESLKQYEEYFLIEDAHNKKLLCYITKRFLNDNNSRKQNILNF